MVFEDGVDCVWSSHEERFLFVLNNGIIGSLLDHYHYQISMTGGTSSRNSAKPSFQNMVSLVAGWVGLGLGDDGRDLGSESDDGDLG